MVSIIESGLTGKEGPANLVTAVKQLSNLVSQDAYDSMLSQMGPDITCVDIVEWFKLYISGDIRNLSSPPSFQFDHMVFDFFHPAKSIFCPPSKFTVELVI